MRALCGLLLATLASAAPPGTVLDLVDLATLPRLTGDVTLQTSSYDRTGGNDDGFSGRFSSLGQTAAGEEILFDETGPGIVRRLWSANADDGGPNALRCYLDDQPRPVLDAFAWHELYQPGAPGLFGPPFAVHYRGGWISYVPIPFRQRCLITTARRARFYQVTWTKLANPAGLASFTGPNHALRHAGPVRRAWERPGEYPGRAAFSRPVAATLSPGAEADLYRASGAGCLRAFRLRVRCADPRWGRKVVLRVQADGQPLPQVWSPVGDFFLDPFRDQPRTPPRSLLLGLDAAERYYCYFPMPHAASLRLSLVNEAAAPVEATLEAWAETWASPHPGLGWFQAWWHREDPVPQGRPFTILQATGAGKWCGVSHAMRGRGSGLGFLEGDELVSTDGRATATFTGTGTEDYFNGGWYFGGTGHQPYWGVTLHDDPGSRCHAYRLHAVDAVPFRREATIAIEHGAHNDYPSADYAGVTYWYAAPGSRHTFRPVPLRDRLGTVPRPAGVTEAEGLAPPAAVRDTVAAGVDLSGGAGVAVGEQPVVCRLGQPESRLARLQVLACGPAAARLTARLNGRELGVASPTATVAELDLGAARWQTSNALELRASGGTVVVDALRLAPPRRQTLGRRPVVEGEALAVVEPSPGVTLTVDELDARWSGLSQLRASTATPGDGFAVLVRVPPPLRQRLVLGLTSGPGNGAVEVLCDGQPVGTGVPAPPTAAGTAPVRVGPLPPGPGVRRLTLRLVGGGSLGLDYLAFEPVPPAGWVELEDLVPTRRQPVDLAVERQPMGAWEGSWSGEAQLWVRPTGPAALDLPLQVAGDSEYELVLHGTRAADYGRFRVLLDGESLAEVDGYGPRVVPASWPLGRRVLRAGAHRLTIEVVGRAAASRGWLVGLDALWLRDTRRQESLVLEGEHLRIVRQEPATAALGPQELRSYGDGWSGDAHLWFRPGNAPAASFTVAANVTETRRYRVGAWLTRAPDYGIVRLEVDGRPLGESVDGYALSVVRSEYLVLGEVELAAGDHEFTIRLQGRNPRSIGSMAGLDALVLE